MVDTIARIKLNNKHYEIIVDLDLALKLRKGENININEALLTNQVFYDSKKGLRVSEEDLETSFQSKDINEIAERIIKKGEIQLTQDYRAEQREQKKKKVIEFYLKNAVDSRTNRPFTSDTLSTALDESGVNINEKSIESQLSSITEGLKKVIPIKIETKKIIITIPAQYTGIAYSLVKDYKEREEWLNDGSLKVHLSIPVGIQSDFYDKINSATHGSVLSQEVKE